MKWIIYFLTTLQILTHFKIIFGSSAIYLLNHIIKYLNPHTHTYIYVFKCMHKYTYAPLAFDQYGFELCGFTYMWIFFNSKCYSTTWSMVAWIFGLGTADIQETWTWRNLHKEGLVKTVWLLFFLDEVHKAWAQKW